MNKLKLILAYAIKFSPAVLWALGLIFWNPIMAGHNPGYNAGWFSSEWTMWSWAGTFWSFNILILTFATAAFIGWMFYWANEQIGEYKRMKRSELRDDLREKIEKNKSDKATEITARHLPNSELSITLMTDEFGERFVGVPIPFKGNLIEECGYPSGKFKLASRLVVNNVITCSPGSTPRSESLRYPLPTEKDRDRPNLTFSVYVTIHGVEIGALVTISLETGDYETSYIDTISPIHSVYITFGDIVLVPKERIAVPEFHQEHA